MAVKSDASSML